MVLPGRGSKGDRINHRISLYDFLQLPVNLQLSQNLKKKNQEVETKRKGRNASDMQVRLTRCPDGGPCSELGKDHPSSTPSYGLLQSEGTSILPERAKA